MFKKATTVRSAYAKLLSDISLNAMSYTDALTCLATIVSLAEEHDLSARAVKAVSRIQQRGLLNLTPSHVSALRPNSPIIGVDHWRLLALHKAIFKAEYKRLTSALIDVATFDQKFVLGQFNAALQCIDKIEADTGVSLWTVRSRIIVLSKQGRHTEVQQYFDEINQQATDPLIPFYFRCFLLLSSSPVLHTRKIIYAHVRELQTAGYKDVSDLLRIMFSTHDERAVDGELSIKIIQNYPLLDQFFMLRGALGNNLANSTKVASVQAKERDMMSFMASLLPAEQRWAEEKNLVRQYEQGMYSECVRTFNSLVDCEQVPFSSIALAVKASVISGTPVSCAAGSPLAEITSSLASLIRMDAHPGVAMDIIRGHVIQAFYTLPGVELKTLVLQIMPNQFTEDQRKYGAAKLMRTVISTSEWVNALSKGGDPLLDHDYALPDETLPPNRALKRSVRLETANANFSVAYELAAQYARSAPLARDQNELISSVHVAAANLPGLIDVCARALTSNPYSYSSFPISLLASYIEKSGGGRDIQSIIVMHFYVKNVDRSKEYLLNESYEEFFFDKGYRRPSEVTLEDVGSVEWYRTLLLDISTVETMDFLGTFSSSADVKSERVKVLDKLMENSLVSAERYRREVDEIASQIVVESGAAELSIHKIDVSESEIRKKVTDDVASLIAVYRAAADGRTDDFIKMDPDSPAAVVAGDRNTTALKILAVVREAFLYDESFGLDKNLSAEIRHGFFSNVMRSKLDTHNLLLELDDQGQYKHNEHWKAANGLLADGVHRRIHQDLEWFTSEFNSLISDAEEWMKVTADPVDVSRIFNYGMYRSEVTVLRTLMDRGMSVEETVGFCIDSLWQLTEKHLVSMRERVNVDLRKRIDETFKELVQRLDESRGHAALLDMMSAVTSARNEIKGDIETVAAWFKRGGIAEGNRSLVDVIAISMEVFRHVRQNKVDWNSSCGPGTELVLIKGPSIKAFVVALINLYENCVRHGGAGDVTKIVISASRVDDTWSIDVTNPISDAVAERLRSGDLDAARERIQSESYSNLVRTEGGTGLRKVLSLLSGINSRFSLDLDLEDKQFKARIGYA